MYIDERVLDLKGAFNVRDLGGYKSQTSSTTDQAKKEQTTKWQRFLRADNLFNLTLEDKEQLYKYGVTTIIDLRSSNELQESPNPFANDANIDYHHISLFEDLNPFELVNQDDVLLGLYLTALSNRRSAFAEVFKLMADAKDGVILFHCMAGKDRTGLIAALLLLNAGVSKTDITEDYIITNNRIKPLISKFLAHAEQSNIPINKYEKLLLCEAQTMVATLEAIDTQFQGIENWFEESGIGKDICDKLNARLLA